MGLALFWGKAMNPELARVVDTPTRRKSRAPRNARGKGPHPGAAAASSGPRTGRSRGTEEGQSDATSDAGESVECSVSTHELVHAVPETMDPRLLPCPAHGDAPGTVAVEAAVQLGAPMAGVGGASGEVRRTGCAQGPIVVDSDVDTDDNSGESGGEPDGSFSVGPTRPSPAQPSGRRSRFMGPERFG